MSFGPVALAAIVRSLIYETLTSIKSDFRGVDFFTVAGQQLIQAREQCLRLGLAKPLEEGTDQHVGFTRGTHDRGSRGFCEVMSSSK